MKTRFGMFCRYCSWSQSVPSLAVPVFTSPVQVWTWRNWTKSLLERCYVANKTADQGNMNLSQWPCTVDAAVNILLAQAEQGAQDRDPQDEEG